MELYSGTLSAGSALVILCTFGLTVLLSMVVLTLVWVRRNVQPLRSRMPKLLLSFNILAILYSASVTFNYVFVEKTQTPCWVFVIIYMMSNSLIGTLVVFRIIKLIFDYSVAVERSNMTHRDANEMMKLVSLRSLFFAALLFSFILPFFSFFPYRPFFFPVLSFPRFVFVSARFLFVDLTCSTLCLLFLFVLTHFPLFSPTRTLNNHIRLSPGKPFRNRLTQTMPKTLL